MKSKEVKKHTPRFSNENFYLFLYDLIKKGWNPSTIAKKCSLSKQVIQYYLSKLKAKGLIRKVGYGTWESTGKRSKNAPQVTKTRGGGVSFEEVKDLVPDSVRSHAFQFTLRLPNKLRNWERREARLLKKKIDFDVLNFGQRLLFKGRKVWLCDNSIVIYEKASYWADTAEDGMSYAIADFLSLVRQLERFLGGNFSWGGKYRFKVSRQHHSLVKNAIAIQYNREGKKLQLFDENGYWGCIDDSLKLKEFETLHPKTADVDNRKVQDYFNGVKKFEGYTPEFLLNAIGSNTKNLGDYAIHLKAHVESVKALGKNVEKQTKIQEKQTEVLNKFVKIVGELKK